MNKIMKRFNITVDDIENYIQSLPPASINNSRALVRELYEKYKKTRSPYYARRIEEVTGAVEDTPSWADESNNSNQN